MVFDYSKLRGKIRERYSTQAEFAKALELSSTALSTKLNNGSQFTQKKIFKSCDLLQIEAKKLKAYFFTLNVQKSNPKPNCFRNDGHNTGHSPKDRPA